MRKTQVHHYTLLSNKNISQKEGKNQIADKLQLQQQYEKDDIILVSISKLKQLLDRYKKQLVSQQQMMATLQSVSTILKNKQSKIKELELPKEISAVNQIKQNNERILKNKIKQLEAKLGNQGKYEIIKPTTPKLHSDIQYSRLSTKLTEKQIQINELERKLILTQTKLQQKIKHSNYLENQNRGIVLELKSTKEILQNLQSKLSQASKQTNARSNGYLKNKLASSNICVSVSPYVIKKDTEEDFIKQIQGLEQSNSALRKQLIHLHAYLQDQDEKYSKNIEALQQKIKKLTEYNHRSQDMKSSTISTRFLTPRKRNQDLEYHFFEEGRLDKSRLLKLADLKISLEVKNQNHDGIVRSLESSIVNENIQN